MSKETKAPPKEIRELSCGLTRDQLDIYRDQLADQTARKIELEAEKSRLSKDYGARIAEMETSNAVISRKISNRSEMRPVECRWSFNWQLGLKYLTRIDTGEVIDTKVITESDSQLYFDLGDDADTAKAEPRDITPVEQIAGTAAPLQIEGTVEPDAAEPEQPVQ